MATKRVLDTRLLDKRASNKNPPAMPTHFVCHGCEMTKPLSSFSKAQQTKSWSNIHNPYAPAGRTMQTHYLTCKTCTPQQTMEMTCHICDKRKSKSEFSKNQRQFIDRAVCMECQKKRLKNDELDGDFDSEAEDTSDSDDSLP